MNKDRVISELLFRARLLLGVPYKYGAVPRWANQFAELNGKEPIKQADCSSFIAYVFWATLGIELIPCTLDIAKDAQGKTIPSFGLSTIGDILFFSGEKNRFYPGGFHVGHVALLSGLNPPVIIHATNSGGKSGVVEHKFCYKEHILYHPVNIVLIKRFA